MALLRVCLGDAAKRSLMYPSHVVAYRSIASGNRSALLHGGVNGNRGSEESSPEPRASGMTSVIKVLLVCVSCGAVITEIAPEPTGHGLPLGKCEAYNRVYDQCCGSS